MGDDVLAVMKRASVFMVLAQAIIHFCPNPSYEKYFRFLAGVMAIVIMAVPLLELLQSGIGERYEKALADAEARIGELLSERTAAPEDTRTLYLDEIEAELTSGIEEYAAQNGLRLRHISYTWRRQKGALAGVRAAFSEGKEDDGQSEIEIGEIGVGPIGRTDSFASLETLREDLAKLLGLDTENVEVRLIE